MQIIFPIFFSFKIKNSIIKQEYKSINTEKGISLINDTDPHKNGGKNKYNNKIIVLIIYDVFNFFKRIKV